MIGYPIVRSSAAHTYPKQFSSRIKEGKERKERKESQNSRINRVIRLEHDRLNYCRKLIFALPSLSLTIAYATEICRLLTNLCYRHLSGPLLLISNLQKEPVWSVMALQFRFCRVSLTWRFQKNQIRPPENSFRGRPRFRKSLLNAKPAFQSGISLRNQLMRKLLLFPNQSPPPSVR